MKSIGALAGLKVIEIGGLGPAPFAAMMLADHGADVLRIERPDKAPVVEGGGEARFVDHDVLGRSRQCAAIDLKNPDGAAVLRELATHADVLIEGFRPGVAERMGFGPEVLHAANPGLIFGRMTGWGQDGPWSSAAGHDINYVSLAGAQAHIGRRDQPPTPALSLVGDFGGGGMLLAFGVMAALFARQRTGRGQVVDAAMVDGAALLMGPLWGASQSGFWSDERGTNLLDSGSAFYDCYVCADGRWVSVGAIEDRFFAALCTGLGMRPSDWTDRNGAEGSARLASELQRRFAEHPRAHWEAVFNGTDACVAPVLTMGEVPDHAHIRARNTIVAVGDSLHPAPAPRFSETPAPAPRAASVVGGDTDAALERWGIAPATLRRLHQANAIS